MVFFALVGFNIIFSVLVMLIPYVFIFVPILRMHSSEGHQKAFSTCASHLTAVSIFYGTGAFMYLQPSSRHSTDTDKMATVFYAIVVPMLNPPEEHRGQPHNSQLISMENTTEVTEFILVGHLSLMDFGYSSAVTPKVMAGFLTEDKIISYNACVTQFFFFAVFIIAESYVLAAVAYDGYAVVCTPLHYTTTMMTNVCARLGIGCYFCGFLNASIHTGNIVRLSFCRSNVVDSFFCDAPRLLALSCSDNYLNSQFMVAFPFLSRSKLMGGSRESKNEFEAEENCFNPRASCDSQMMSMENNTDSD
eukprot:bmy_21031T0